MVFSRRWHVKGGTYGPPRHRVVVPEVAGLAVHIGKGFPHWATVEGGALVAFREVVVNIFACSRSLEQKKENKTEWSLYIGLV